MATIKENLEALRRLVPKRSAHGQLYRTRADLTIRWTRIRLYTVMVSDSNNFRTHQGVFKKKEPGKSAVEWHAWLKRNFRAIYDGGILPGLNVMDSSQSWSVKEVIGWTGDLAARKRKVKRNDKRRTAHSKVVNKRHKAKRQGRTHG